LRVDDDDQVAGILGERAKTPVAILKRSILFANAARKFAQAADGGRDDDLNRQNQEDRGGVAAGPAATALQDRGVKAGGHDSRQHPRTHPEEICDDDDVEPSDHDRERRGGVRESR